ncbi:unnamed protein product [Phyllotreta striolata]|uniref:Tetraspanin n=1 Tax=Phyllotreta striolata TaxID=444603 RepID=A0A9N9TVZ7_PHYSR|nr:unnamed protein product [Phyllotreta striolata]
MNLSCGSRTIKYLIFSFNFFFAITGIILIAVGASIHANYLEYNFFLSNHYFSLPNLLIATGSIIFFICFLGCYGAVKNSWIMLLLFSVLLGVIFIFEFSAGIAGYVLRDKTEGFLESSMKDTIQEYQQGKQPAMHMWDTIQDNFKCCGVTSLNDWNATDPRLPISCCPRQEGATGTFTCSKISPTQSTEKPATKASTQKPNEDSNTNKAIRKRQVQVNAVNSNAGNDTHSEGSANTNASPATATMSSNATETSISASTVGNSSPEPTSSTITSSSRPSASNVDANSTTTTVLPSSTTIPYPEGCAQSFGSWVKVHAVDIGAVCFTLAVLQLIGIGFACHLSQQMKKAYYST